MAEIDDHQLMKCVAQGDERAFLTLYDCYVGRVHALTLRILGNPMLAEEATQDTFLKLWSRSREYQPERGLLLTWLLTIARRTVSLGKNDQLGSFLVDDKGMTLYLFTKDTPDTSVCYDKCATAWPPLLTTGDPVAAEGVDASLLGTTKRTDGTVQVTYNGWPIYYYEKDKIAGDVTGQDVGGVWYVVSATGDKVTTP